mgnify:CR=1 FL=1
MQDYYGNVMEMALEEIALYTDEMEELNSVLDHYSNILELVGKQEDYATKGKVLNAKATNLRNEMQVQQELYEKSNLANPSVIVDTNHNNSGKKYLEQVRIAKEVLQSCRHDSSVKKLVKGFMIESYIEDGAQKIGECIYGKSITDPCLGWEKTERLILDIADLL